MKVTFLGQAGLLFETDRCKVMIDPYLSDSVAKVNPANRRRQPVDESVFSIRSNVVLPGTVKTERWVQMGNTRIVDGVFTPIGDISDFEDIANAAFYLGTDLSKNVTGTELTVDGGMSCQLYPQLLNVLKKESMR